MEEEIKRSFKDRDLYVIDFIHALSWDILPDWQDFNLLKNIIPRSHQPKNLSLNLIGKSLDNIKVLINN
jgi:hypothetical protein